MTPPSGRGSVLIGTGEKETVIFSTEVSLLYLKAPKTAGSSIELWLARQLFGALLVETGEHPEMEPRIDRHGVVTRIGLSQKTKFEIHPHTTLDGALKVLGEDTVNSSKIVTCVRNPFDQVFSFFWWKTKVVDRALHARLLKAGRTEIYLHFNRFVKKLTGGWLRQKNFLTTETGSHVAHHVLRFENLDTEFDSFAREVLGLNSFPALPRLKTGLRPTGLSYGDFYSSRSKTKIETIMAWELQNLGYRF